MVSLAEGPAPGGLWFPACRTPVPCPAPAIGSDECIDIESIDIDTDIDIDNVSPVLLLWCS